MLLFFSLIMVDNSFHDYIYSTFNSKKSAAAPSYLKAISIIDEIFKKRDIFNLGNKSLTEIKDPLLIGKIIEFIVEEEDKFRAEQESFFDLGLPTQTSYPKRRFCTAAIRKLGEYVNQKCGEEAIKMMHEEKLKGSALSSKLLKKYHLDDKGTEKETTTKRRIGQDMFRSILLDIYEKKCCLTGIDVPEVLRASHIIPWAERLSTRMNPENGLCLSATYDAAFDKHLISFDKNFRLILSPHIKDAYTSEAFKTFFQNYEGKKINLPTMYLPSQKYLEEHRLKLIN